VRRPVSCPVVDSVEVVTVGHALVDVVARADDAHVAGLGLDKGTMTLVDDEASERIYASLPEVTTVSGGSAANTAVGLAAFGRRTAFIGKVRDDELGRVFAEDICGAGVHFAVAAATDGPGTGRSMILVTPDAEKTMCTNLGAGDLIGPDDVDVELVERADVVYLEGYLCGLPHTDPTVKTILAAADRGGTTVALSLSDPLWVELHGAELAALLPRVDILFANEQEACGIAGTPHLDRALDTLAESCPTVVVTRGPSGCVTRRHGRHTAVDAAPVERVVDTTGAGDTFAAGFLHGLLLTGDAEAAARLGSLASAEVIGHLGARPRRTLQHLTAHAGIG